MKNEKWDDVHGNTTPDDRMVAFLERNSFRRTSQSFLLWQTRFSVKFQPWTMPPLRS